MATKKAMIAENAKPEAKELGHGADETPVVIAVATDTAPPTPALKPTNGKAVRKDIIHKEIAPLARTFLFDLASAIREAVLPYVQGAKGRDIVGTATSGDATFELDEVAEKALLSFLKRAKLPIAYYSEDKGYTTFSNAQPENLLVVDPVDGSRAAKCGFEACVVSLVSTRVMERPTMAGVDNACVMEILGGRTFYAEHGKGARIYADSQSKRPKLSKNADLTSMCWSMSVPGRPAELTFPTVYRLMDMSSLRGGFFACNSTAYSLTRLVTGQLDAHVDIANRYLRDLQEAIEGEFINAGNGAIVGMAPYDLAAPLMIAKEAGCIVTDAYGAGFDDLLLLDSTVSNQQSVIAAANPELHAKLLEFLDNRIPGIERTMRIIKKRAGEGDS